MALKACKECGAKISSIAVICPSCGVQSPGISVRSSVKIFLLITLAIVFVAAITAGGNQSVKPDEEVERSSNIKISTPFLDDHPASSQLNEEKKSVSTKEVELVGSVDTSRSDYLNVPGMVKELMKIKGVKDAVYLEQNPYKWHVAIVDKGQRIDWLAASVCTILGEHGYVDDATYVRIVDAVKISRGQDFQAASLGRRNCVLGEQSYP